MCYCNLMVHLAKDRQLFCCRGYSYSDFLAVAQNLSQKLTSEGNADPSNAAALLHALHLGPTKDVTMCYCHLMVHLAKHRQLFSAAARPNMWK
jgi:hypothetical protein